MKIPRPDLAAYVLAALAIVCLTVLLLFARQVPDYFPLIVMTLVGAGGGMALNTSNGSETVSGGTRAPSPAPAARATVPPQRPASAPAQAPGGLA